MFSQIKITGYRSLGVSNVPNADDSTTAPGLGRRHLEPERAHVQDGVQAYRLATVFRSSQRERRDLQLQRSVHRATRSPTSCSATPRPRNLSKWATCSTSRRPYTHLFVQDDWRLSRRLTLNLGLRYEIEPAAGRRARRHRQLRPRHRSGESAAGARRGGGRRPGIAGADGCELQAVRAARRGGLQPAGRQDGGARRLGIFYSNLITVGGMQSLEINPPNHLRINRATDRTAAPTMILSQGFEPNALTSAAAADVNLVSHERSNTAPTSYQWNVNVQRELPGRFVVEIGYVGNRFENNWRRSTATRRRPGRATSTAAGSMTATDPVTGDSFTLADITRIQKDGWSPSTTACRRGSSAATATACPLLASYAYSRNRALEGGFQDSRQHCRGDRPGVDRSPAPLRGQRGLPAAVRKGPPVRRELGRAGRTRVLGGWALSPIVTLTSGAPLDVSVNGNPSNSTAPIGRTSSATGSSITRPPSAWFNTDAFVANAPYTYGDAPRNLLRGPGYANLDLALRKAFRCRTAQPSSSASSRSTPPTASTSATRTPRPGNPSFGAHLGDPVGAASPGGHQVRCSSGRAPAGRRPPVGHRRTRRQAPPSWRSLFRMSASPRACSAGRPRSAHHAFAAEFDRQQAGLTRRHAHQGGVVNPHGWICVDVKGTDAKVTNWAIEFGSAERTASPRAAQGGFSTGASSVTVKGSWWPRAASRWPTRRR